MYYRRCVIFALTVLCARIAAHASHLDTRGQTLRAQKHVRAESGSKEPELPDQLVHTFQTTFGDRFLGPASEKITPTCLYVLWALPLVCCCTVPLVYFYGRMVVVMLICILLFIVGNLFVHSVFDKVLSGEITEGPCWWLSWILTLSFTGVCCLASVFLILRMYYRIVKEKKIDDIENEAVRQIRRAFDEKVKPDEKPYYTTKEFKDRCDAIFIAADADTPGKLKLEVLRSSFLTAIDKPNKTAVKNDSNFVLAFDTKGATEVDKEEFMELVKYFDLTFKVTKDNSWNDLYTSRERNKSILDIY